MNSMVSRLLTIITGRLITGIIECTHASNIQSINQGDQTYISIQINYLKHEKKNN